MISVTGTDASWITTRGHGAQQQAAKVTEPAGAHHHRVTAKPLDLGLDLFGHVAQIDVGLKRHTSSSQQRNRISQHPLAFIGQAGLDAVNHVGSQIKAVIDGAGLHIQDMYLERLGEFARQLNDITQGTHGVLGAVERNQDFVHGRFPCWVMRST